MLTQKCVYLEVQGQVRELALGPWSMAGTTHLELMTPSLAMAQVRRREGLTWHLWSCLFMSR